MSLDSYNSTYPIEYYEVGTCYSFYKDINGSNQRAATSEEIAKFSEALEKCYSENRHIMTAGGSSYNKSISRAVGVVIEKGPLGSSEFKNALDVMFMGADGSYFVTRYGITGKNVFLNDKESITPGKVVPGEYTPAGKPVVPGKPAASGAARKSGPTEVTKSGPTEVKKAGPTEVKTSGPTQVEG